MTTLNKRVSSFLFISLFLLLFLKSNTHAFASFGYGPNQIKSAYNLPQDGGNGTVAIVGPEHYEVEEDLNTFSQLPGFDLPSCTQASGCLTIHRMSASPQYSLSNAIETSLDTQWVHAIAPNAKLLLVVTNSLNPMDLLNAISYAANQPGVVAVSMSFGSNENDKQDPTLKNLCSVFVNQNVSYFASAGDYGTAVSWPALCPQVISVGGTTLNMNGNSVTSETAWSASPCSSSPTGICGSGGGLSVTVQEPSYQNTFIIPNANGFRGVPDVSADANKATGVTVIFQGSSQVVGGTSLSAPIWAGIAALTGGPLTHDLLYNNAKSSTYAQYYRDIAVGTNGSCGYYCTAQVGYDYVTGLGSPLGVPTGTGTVPSVSTPTPTVPPSSSSCGSLGDVNGDGKVNSIDANLILQYDAGYSVNNFIKANGDVNGDGKVNSIDASLILQYDKGLISIFPACSSSPIPTLSPGVPTPTPISASTPTLPPIGAGGGGGGTGGLSSTPTTTSIVTYSCYPDPKCASGQKNLQLCLLICTPQ